MALTPRNGPDVFVKRGAQMESGYQSTVFADRRNEKFSLRGSGGSFQPRFLLAQEQGEDKTYHE
jgi:hypothetical protein